MTVKELADYFGKTTCQLSIYVEKNFGINISPIGTIQVEDRHLKVIAPSLYTRERIKHMHEFSGETEKEKSRKKIETFLLCAIHGEMSKAIEIVNNATESELVEYEKGLCMHVFQNEPDSVSFWQIVKALAETNWTLLTMTMRTFRKKKAYANRILKKNKECMLQLIGTYMEKCDSIMVFNEMVHSLTATFNCSLAGVIARAAGILHHTYEYDNIIDDMRLDRNEMIDFLLLCNTKIGLYVLGRNLLDSDRQGYFNREMPSDREIQQIYSRILKECTVYPEIEYIALAIKESVKPPFGSWSSILLRKDDYKGFWNEFYLEREKQIERLTINKSIKKCFIVKVEQNFLIVRFGLLTGKVNKKDLFHTHVKDLRIYFEQNEIINNLVITSFDVKKDKMSKYPSCQISLCRQKNPKYEWQTFVWCNKGKPMQAKVVDVSDRGVLVSLGPGVESFIRKTNITAVEYDCIRCSQLTHPELDVIIKSIDFDNSRCEVVTCGKSTADELWDNIGEFYEENQAYDGKLLSKLDKYHIIQLAEGAEVRVYNNELCWQNCMNSVKDIEVNTDVRVLILSIDKEWKYMKGSIKRLTPNPWEIAKATISAGEPCEVKVTDISDENLTVETMDSFRLVGKIKRTELSWYKQDGDEMPLIGSALTAKVVVFNPDKCKLVLSVRQLEENPWNNLFVGKQIFGMVMSINDNRSVNVRLENGMDAQTADFEQMLQIGEVYPFKIISFKQTLKEIVLSHQELLFDRLTEDIVKSFFNT